MRIDSEFGQGVVRIVLLALLIGGRTTLRSILSLSSISCFNLRGSQPEDGSKTEDLRETISGSRVIGSFRSPLLSAALILLLSSQSVVCPDLNSIYITQLI